MCFCSSLFQFVFPVKVKEVYSAMNVSVGYRVNNSIVYLQKENVLREKTFPHPPPMSDDKTNTLSTSSTSTPSSVIPRHLPIHGLGVTCSCSRLTCCVSEKHDGTTRTVSTQSLFSVGTQRQPGTQGPERRGHEVTLTPD